MSTTSHSIHTDGHVTITTEWLNKNSTKRTRLLIIKTENNEVTFFMDEDDKILLDIGRD
jgi:hypothetical protein